MGVTIQPDTFYRPDDVKRIFGFSIHSLDVACRNGELRFVKQSGQRFFRGQWLIDWLDGKPSLSRSGDSQREAIPA